GSAALQVHGGMGYIEETGAAQHLRDARINMIYEGTNGIQALDLVGRKLTMAGGRLPHELFEELDGDLERLGEAGESALRKRLGSALEALRSSTRWLQGKLDNEPDAALAGATPYLRQFATLLGAFLLARASLVGRAEESDQATERRRSAVFFADHVLPPAVALEAAVSAGLEPLASPAFATR
ncbi:MAG: acyl-CoA dehydrogenase, partial [Geminicoccaceae bacterium]|nr:acyl-CoA dehydrogenase [Geminicoccaceae bacterium]